jgi:hypothetical protein
MHLSMIIFFCAVFLTVFLSLFFSYFFAHFLSLYQAIWAFIRLTLFRINHKVGVGVSVFSGSSYTVFFCRLC